MVKEKIAKNKQRSIKIKLKIIKGIFYILLIWIKFSMNIFNFIGK